MALFEPTLGSCSEHWFKYGARLSHCICTLLDECQNTVQCYPIPVVSTISLGVVSNNGTQLYEGTVISHARTLSCKLQYILGLCGECYTKFVRISVNVHPKSTDQNCCHCEF